MATLDAMGEAVEDRPMPPDSYLEFHPQGRLSDEERRILHDWTFSERYRLQVELMDKGKVPKVAAQ